MQSQREVLKKCFREIIERHREQSLIDRVYFIKILWDFLAYIDIDFESFFIAQMLRYAIHIQHTYIYTHTESCIYHLELHIMHHTYKSKQMIQSIFKRERQKTREGFLNA